VLAILLGQRPHKVKDRKQVLEKALEKLAATGWEVVRADKQEQHRVQVDKEKLVVYLKVVLSLKVSSRSFIEAYE
jgi:hypothetical protein